MATNKQITEFSVLLESNDIFSGQNMYGKQEVKKDTVTAKNVHYVTVGITGYFSRLVCPNYVFIISIFKKNFPVCPLIILLKSIFIIVNVIMFMYILPFVNMLPHCISDYPL